MKIIFVISYLFVVIFNIINKKTYTKDEFIDYGKSLAGEYKNLDDLKLE